jgi:hypothetical protein
MSVAMPAATTAPAVPVSGRRRGTITGAGRGESGKFLGQFPGTAMRTGGALPVAGAHKNFAVALALFAMKFVNWHGRSIIGFQEISSRTGMGLVFSFCSQSLALRA